MLTPYIQQYDGTKMWKPVYKYSITNEKALQVDRSIENVFQKGKKYRPEAEIEHTVPQYVEEVEEAPVAEKTYFSESFSHEYVDFKRQNMLQKLSNEMTQWINKGENSLPHVANIKIMLDEYSDYLTQYPDTRILLGTLELIFNNNEWDKIPQNKLRFFKSKLDYLAVNELDFKQIKTFMQEVHTAKIRVIHPGYEPKQGEA